MPRTYSFDHFTAAKPDVSKQKKGSERERSTPLKSEQPPPPDGQFNYGHRHAQTEQLYKQHREEHERQEALSPKPKKVAKAREEPAVPGKAKQEMKKEEAPLEQGREQLKELAQQAISSVRKAAREAARGRPLKATRQLAGDVFTGARRVAREVSARTGLSSEKRKGDESEDKSDE
jgi:hypothetical protein